MNRKEAKELGEKHYDGKPCKKCGTTKKFTSNWTCVQCTTEKTLNRDPEVYKKYIKSEKGQEWLKEYRHSKTYREVQNRWTRSTGFNREQTARRRKQIVDSYKELSDNEKLEVKGIYQEAARLTCETGVMHHVDHIQPLFEGGKHHPSNLQILTTEQHWKKCADENKRRMN